MFKKILVCSFATGYIPKSWRDITVNFIPKVGRASYEEAKSFRPINLTSFLLKCLEHIVDHHIRDVHLANVPLHVNQHDYQSGKSAVILLHKGVYDIEKVFAQNQSCLGVFLDIEGAFDNVPFDAILEAARSHGISPMISNRIHQMLKNRYLLSTLRLAGIRKLSVCGCRQGGILSSLLWNLVADTVIRGQIDHFKTTFAHNMCDNSNIAKRISVKPVPSGSLLNHVTELCSTNLNFNLDNFKYQNIGNATLGRN